MQLKKNIMRLVGRNDPCPCGKKKEDGTPVKFKKCCLRLYQSGELRNA